MPAQVLDLLQRDTTHGVVGVVRHYDRRGADVPDAVHAGITYVTLGGLSPRDRIAETAERLRGAVYGLCLRQLDELSLQDHLTADDGRTLVVVAGEDRTVGGREKSRFRDG
uniref:(northern house mosquito) hypothetical protein n=1 Tax=Culex pipiens TaxID=7175 RepID=A0A8D8GM94_CULPI